ENAAQQAESLYRRYPDVKLVWAGNDLMAFGAMAAWEKRGGKPGVDAWFSGVNTSTEALEAVKSGRLTSLAGGHFITGARALVMIYDYHHGRDFADEGLKLRRPMFAEFTPLLADRYIERFSGGFDGVDFSRYSKVKTPKLRRYNFGFAQLLEPQSCARSQRSQAARVQFDCVSERLRSRTRSRWLAQAQSRSARVQSDDRIFQNRHLLRSRSLADLASSRNSRRPSNRAARESGRTKYRKRKISSEASICSLANCGSPTSIATSMTPRLPGAWLKNPSRIAVTKTTSNVMKSIAGCAGSKVYIAVAPAPRSKIPIPICTRVRRGLGRTICQF